MPTTLFEFKIKKMKNARLLVVMSAAVLIGLTSCQESVDLSVSTVDGIYRGSLTYESSLKSTSVAGTGSSDAIAEVTDLGDGQIEVHCFGDEMDTTFILNSYEHNNMVMVCLDGEAFEQMYGHMMGSGQWNNGMNHSGGMRSSNGSRNSEWLDHMENDHSEGDEHFGGFNMTERTFDYTIEAEDGDYHFLGTKM